MKFKEFEKADWYGFAGAERFPNGDEPLVSYDIEVDDLPAIAVLDANGLAIQVMTPEGGTVAYFFADGNVAARFLVLVGQAPVTIETGLLVDAGFTEERGEDWISAHGQAAAPVAR